MAVSKLDFAAKMEAFEERSRKRMQRIFQRSTLALFEEVQNRTPVRTGFLRNSLGASTAGVPPIDRLAMERGSAVNIQPYDLVCQTARLGDTISGGFVAAYSGYVEYGTSRMAPRRMVGLSVQRWNELVDEAAREVRSEIR